MKKITTSEVEHVVHELLSSKEVIINCGESTREVMEKVLQELPNADIVKLKLENFAHHKLTFLRAFNLFDTTTTNYIPRVMLAIINNHHIHSLELDNEFVRNYHPSKDAYSFATLNISYLVNMQGLKELILYNNNWNPTFFESLQKYLIDSRCTLETLVLKETLCSQDVMNLKTTFEAASSLKYYRGVGDHIFQPILDRRWNAGLVESKKELNINMCP